MEAEKRKQADHGVSSGTQKKAREEETAVTEEEVEEFVAILSRMKAAIRYFENSDRVVLARNLMEEGTKLRTILEDESIGEVNAVKEEEPRSLPDRDGKKVGFDLNVDPNPEGDSDQI